MEYFESEKNHVEFHRLKDETIEEMYQFGKIFDDLKMLKETNSKCLNTMIEEVNKLARMNITRMQEFRHILELKATISKMEDSIIDKYKM